jgi:transcriptional regulator with XRE-family HTH domain
MKNETIGQRLKRLRHAAGISQEKLAEASGVPVGTIRGIEYDRREPLLTTAAKLARALGASVDTLVENGGTAEKSKRKKKGK